MQSLHTSHVHQQPGVCTPKTRTQFPLSHSLSLSLCCAAESVQACTSNTPLRVWSHSLVRRQAGRTAQCSANALPCRRVTICQATLCCHKKRTYPFPRRVVLCIPYQTQLSPSASTSWVHRPPSVPQQKRARATVVHAVREHAWTNLHPPLISRRLLLRRRPTHGAGLCPTSQGYPGSAYGLRWEGSMANVKQVPYCDQPYQRARDDIYGTLDAFPSWRDTPMVINAPTVAKAAYCPAYAKKLQNQLAFAQQPPAPDPSARHTAHPCSLQR